MSLTWNWFWFLLKISDFHLWEMLFQIFNKLFFYVCMKALQLFWLYFLVCALIVMWYKCFQSHRPILSSRVCFSSSSSIYSSIILSINTSITIIGNMSSGSYVILYNRCNFLLIPMIGWVNIAGNGRA